MFQGVFQLIHKVEDKEVKLLVDAGTQMPHLKEALVQFLCYAVQFEKEQIEAQKAKEKTQADVTHDVKQEV
jgi:predicted aspartyl protease